MELAKRLIAVCAVTFTALALCWLLYDFIVRAPNDPCKQPNVNIQMCNGSK
jgi:hypothetical protein